MAQIPQNVRDMVENQPVEDLILPLLREGLGPDVPVYSEVPDITNPFPFVLVRREYSQMFWRGDMEFVDSAYVSIDSFTEDPDGDEQGAILSEACRVILRDAWRTQKVVPGAGSISYIQMINEPRRAADWQSATGPVQYADLPNGAWRYVTVYRIYIRRPI